MEALRIMTQNLLCADRGEGLTVEERAKRFSLLMQEIMPDLLGTQETTPYWNECLSAYDAEYGRIGVSREGREADFGEWNTVLYRKDRFTLLASDTFWLTETPAVTGRVEGSRCTRICTWARLRDEKNGTELLFANTHLDHGADTVRQVQAEHLMRELGTLAGPLPVFLTGDFNARPGSLPYQTVNGVLDDAHISCVTDESAVSYTFHSFGTCEEEIDYLFYDGEKADCSSYRILDMKYDGWVSDHYGVLASFVLK